MQRTPLFTLSESTVPGRLHWWFLVAAVVALLLGLNFGSAGVTRGGDEDEGSGIGGTGRKALPGGESGLGGTGLRPFVSINAEREVEATLHLRDDLTPVVDPRDLDIPPVMPVNSSVIAATALAAREVSFTRNSGPIDISEQIQRDLDSNALTFHRLRLSQDNGPAQREATARPDNTGLADDPVAGPELAARDNADAAEEQRERRDAEVAATGDGRVSWQELAGFLAENAAADDEEDAASHGEAQTRLSRPERLQRPELPQVQRVRPIQRAAVLPPRIKPLAL